jgi:hypothetical protein
VTMLMPYEQASDSNHAGMEMSLGLKPCTERKRGSAWREYEVNAMYLQGVGCRFKQHLAAHNYIDVDFCPLPLIDNFSFYV